MIALRLYLLTQLNTEVVQKIVLGDMLSLENEFQMLQILLGLLKEHLTLLGSIEVRCSSTCNCKEDNKLIDSDALSFHGELAVWYRKSCKKLLAKAIKTIESLLLQSNLEDFVLQMQKLSF